MKFSMILDRRVNKLIFYILSTTVAIPTPPPPLD